MENMPVILEIRVAWSPSVNCSHVNPAEPHECEVSNGSGNGYDVFRQKIITWANDDTDLCNCMVPLGYSGSNCLFPNQFRHIFNEPLLKRMLEDVIGEKSTLVQMIVTLKRRSLLPLFEPMLTTIPVKVWRCWIISNLSNFVSWYCYLVLWTNCGRSILDDIISSSLE